MLEAREGRFRRVTTQAAVGDSRPPTIRTLGQRGSTLRLVVSDGGAGVDPASLQATVDGRVRGVTFAGGIARISLAGVPQGRHTLVFRAADYQETKNNETVLNGALPNTRTVQLHITVR